LTDANLTTNGGTGLMMVPTDMTKLGLLYLYQGKWDQQQLVPEEWVIDSTRQHFDTGWGSPGYGYHWWLMQNGF
jgi:CubicO group peptidase (beta-lactamase class C family)